MDKNKKHPTLPTVESLTDEPQRIAECLKIRHGEKLEIMQPAEYEDGRVEFIAIEISN